ncbi:MAG: thiol:disulfide interchange protein DsbA/DsbL [Betaproteobacteria bacterium]|nr:thiol:disulfide interchange protein DsbA/DsbL [Betaproteobacteria bacterium]
MKVQKFLGLCLLAMGLVAIAARAEVVAGRDYMEIKPAQPTQSGRKIEVIEFFWYGCPHCNDLHPYIKAWLKKKPADVEFRYVPAIFRDSWVPNAKLYYALDAIGELNKLHDQVYDAIHLDNLNLNSDQVLLDWIAKRGVDGRKFSDAYNSFSMQGKVARSTQMSRDYQLRGVPSLAVDGKYLTSGSFAGSPESMLKVVDELVAKARNERGTKK